ncbi:MAG: ribosome maturation factor RimM [Chloroflexota bacterium]
MSDRGGELVTIGRVVKEWGVRGEVRVAPLSTSTECFESLREVAVAMPGKRGVDEGEYVWKMVRSVSVRGASVILAFDDCRSPEEARKYRGAFLRMTASEIEPLPEGVYYHHQIVGLTVVTVEGERLGKVEEIIETGSNDVYVVRGQGREYLVPAVRDVVKGINLDDGTMKVALLEAVE